MKEVITRTVDDGNFFEIMPELAKNIIIGLGRFEGQPVGIVANQVCGAVGNVCGF